MMMMLALINLTLTSFKILASSSSHILLLSLSFSLFSPLPFLRPFFSPSLPLLCCRNLSVVSLVSIPPDVHSFGKFPNVKLPQIHRSIMYSHFQRPKLNFLQDKKKSASNKNGPDRDIATSHQPISCPSHLSSPPNTSMKDSSNSTFSCIRIPF